MKRIFPILIAIAFCWPAFGQSLWPATNVQFSDSDTLQAKFNAGDLGGVGVGTFASLPVSGVTAGIYVVIDCTTTACTAGGGSIWATRQWDGSAWSTIENTNAQTVCSGSESLRGDGSCTVPSSSGSNPLDDFATVNCSAGIATIGSASGVIRVLSGCSSGDTIEIANLPTFDSSAAILQSIVNDSGQSLVIDATNNTSTIESGSLTVPDGATFSVVQTAASTVHVIGTGVGFSFDQTIPEASVIHEPFIVNITSPTTASFGWGITEAPKNSFSATPENEPDHQFGTYYNLSGVSGQPVNGYEHAWNAKAETSFRGTTETSNETWVEWNRNMFPADSTSVVTGVTGTFVVDEAITFSPSGATGKVLAWDGGTSTLTFRMDGGGDPTASTDTIAASGSGASATLGPVTNITTNKFRSYLEIYKTLQNIAQFEWHTSPTEDDIPLVVRLGGVGVNWPAGVNENFAVGSKRGASGNPALKVRWRSDGFDGTSAGNVRGIALMLENDFSGTNTSFFKSELLRIAKPPNAIGTGSEVFSSASILIEDQKAGTLQRNNSPSDVMVIEAQGCLNTQPCTAAASGYDGEYGNVNWAGGNWNTGHLKFGTTGAIGDHLWRDQTNEVFRVSQDNAPDAETEGAAVVTGSLADTHGPSMWGISNAGTIQSGDDLCGYTGATDFAGVGMTCVDVIEFSTVGTPTDSTCATNHANTVKFLAMCK